MIKSVAARINNNVNLDNPDKTIRIELLGDFCGISFLKSGDIYNLTSFTQKIDPNLNINDIRKLLRIHFVLTYSNTETKAVVIDFIDCLSERIRRVKTTMKRETEDWTAEVFPH